MSKYDKMIALNKKASDEKIARAMKEISRMVGYENSSYFCSVFARRFGASPNEYRGEILG